MTAALEHQRVDRLFASAELKVDASEVHGIFSGLICAGHADGHVEWFDGLFSAKSSDDLLVKEARELMGQLYLESRRQLASKEIEFTLFLPGDERPLSERVQGLAQWAGGFLYGLGLSGLTEAQLANEVKEALRDIAEISRLDYEHVENDEESEQAFAELEEFLRVATLLVQEEMSPRRGESDDVH